MALRRSGPKFITRTAKSSPTRTTSTSGRRLQSLPRSDICSPGLRILPLETAELPALCRKIILKLIKRIRRAGVQFERIPDEIEKKLTWKNAAKFYDVQ